MKKVTYVRRATRYTSSRFGMGAQNSVCYLTDGEEAEAKAKEKLLKTIETKIQEQMATRASKADVDAIMADLTPELRKELKGLPLEGLRSLLDPDKGVMKIIADQGIEMKKLQTQLHAQPLDMSTRGQIKRWLESESEEGSTKKVSDIVKEIRAGKKADLKPLELIMNTRAVQSPMLPSGTLGGSAYLPIPEFAPGIVDVVRPQPTFWNYIKKGATGSAAYVWVNKKVPAGLGAAAFIAPGVYKPGISFTIDTQISNAKKIAANEKVAIELLDDIEGLTSWVETELMYQINQKASLTLMSSAGDANTPTGIQNLSVPFAGVALGVSTLNANNWDAIRACVAQLQAANFLGYEITAFINPIDMANMVMTKANNQGQLFIPPVTGATIVVDNNVPVGKLQIACLDLYKILIYKGFTMTWGLENDDFTKNLRTVIGEMRIHQFFSENHVGSLIFDTFANIIAGINQAPAA